MRAAIYVRVSTDEERQNIDNQLIPLRKMAEMHGFQVVDEFVDYASGGNPNRPKFQEMLKRARKREFDIVLVWALDRFSREGMLNTLSYINDLQQSGVALKSLQETWLDTTDRGTGQLLLGIMSWIAQQERLRLSERIKAGQRNAVNLGKRGKDKKPRRRAGYIARWMQQSKKIPPLITTPEAEATGKHK